MRMPLAVVALLAFLLGGGDWKTLLSFGREKFASIIPHRQPAMTHQINVNLALREHLVVGSYRASPVNTTYTIIKTVEKPNQVMGDEAFEVYECPLIDTEYTLIKPKNGADNDAFFSYTQSLKARNFTSDQSFAKVVEIDHTAYILVHRRYLPEVIKLFRVYGRENRTMDIVAEEDIFTLPTTRGILKSCSE